MTKKIRFLIFALLFITANLYAGAFGGGAIKSIQRGTFTITTTGTATLSPAVVVANTDLRLLGYTAASTANPLQADAVPYIELTDTTTITGTRTENDTTLTISYEITERY